MITRTRGASRAGNTLEIVALVASGYAAHLYYNLIGHLASLRGVDYGPSLVTAVDRVIPYMPFWVNFYQLAYFMPAVVIVLVLLKIGLDVVAVRRLVVSFTALLFVHYLLYLIVPTSARAIRLDDGALGAGWLGDLVRYQYSLATAWCAWPSLHVSACWFFYRLLARAYPRLGWVYLAWFVGMFLGTVSIKIHYVLDGVIGFVFGECAYRYLLVRLEQTGGCTWTWSSPWLRFVVHLGILALLLAGLPLVMRASGFDGPLYTI